MSWELKATWPVTSWEEVTYMHFEDLRKMMFAISRLVDYTVGYEDYAEWDAKAFYRSENVTSTPAVLYNGRPYVYTGSGSLGEPPDKGNGWILCAREDVYSDFNVNSGCETYRADGTERQRWPAYLHLPPQYNKYTQLRRVSNPDKWRKGVNYVVGTLVKDTNDDKPAYLYSCLQANLSDHSNGLHNTDYWNRFENSIDTIPAEKIYGRSQEKAIELQQYEYNKESGEWEYVFSGPIGARFAEWHGSGFGLPWTYPYHVVNGQPWPANSYYDYKMQGWASFIENFVERNGAKFYWPFEDANYIEEKLIAGDKAWETLRDNADMSEWHCNRSAFEKCLELTGECDWYLDTQTPPDPYILRFTDGGYYIKGVWRKFWKHSYGYPEGDVFWPQEWGDPPYVDEDYDWWKDWGNVYKARDKALARHRAEPEGMELLNERHAAKTFTVKANDTYNYTYSHYEPKFQILNEMKAVLECLKYVEFSADVDTEYGRKDYSCPMQTIRYWDPIFLIWVEYETYYATWEGAVAAISDTPHIDEWFELAGYNNLTIGYDGEVRINVPDYGSQYPWTAGYTIYKEAKYKLSNFNDEHIFDYGDPETALLGVRLHGATEWWPYHQAFRVRGWRKFLDSVPVSVIVNGEDADYAIPPWYDNPLYPEQPSVSPKYDVLEFPVDFSVDNNTIHVNISTSLEHDASEMAPPPEDHWYNAVRFLCGTIGFRLTNVVSDRVPFLMQFNKFNVDLKSDNIE